MRAFLRRFAMLSVAMLLYQTSADAQILRSLADRAARAIGERTEIRNGQAYVKTSYTENNVDLKKLSDRLTWLGVPLPLQLSGDVDVDLKLDVPVGSPRTLSLYTFSGTVKSKSLKIENLEVRDLDSGVSLNNGVLNLDRMSFAVTDVLDASRSGMVSGKAQAALSPSGNLTASLNLSDVSAQSILSLFPDLSTLKGGHLSGSLEAGVPVRQLRQLNAWTITGPISVANIDIGDRTLVEASAEAKLASGNLQLHDFRGELEDIRFTGLGNLAITAPFSYSAKLQMEELDLANLQAVIPTLAADLSGEAIVSLNAKGQFSPFLVDGSGNAELQNATIASVRFDRLQFAYDANSDLIEFRDAKATLYDGTAVGSVSLPISDQSAFRADITWSDVALHKLVRGVKGQTPRFAGKSSGRLKVESPTLAGLLPTQQPDLFLADVILNAAWRFEGHVISRDGQNLPSPNATTIPFTLDFGAELHDRQLTLSTMKAAVGMGTLSGVGDVRFAASPEARLDIDGEGIDVAQVADVVSAFDLFTRAVEVADEEQRRQPLQAQGTVSLTNADVLGIRTGRISFIYQLSRQRMTVSELTAEVHDGSVTGSAEIPLAGSGPLSASLSWDAIDAAKLLPHSGAVRGVLAGNATIAIADVAESFPRGLQEFQRHHDWKGITADGSLRFAGAVRLTVDADNATAAETATASLETNWHIRGDAGALQRLHVRLGDGQINGSGTLQLKTPHAWTAGLSVTDIDLRAVNALSREWLPELTLGGIANLNVDASGQLSPAALSGTGEGTLRNLVINDAVIEEFELAFRADGRQIHVERMATSLYGGTISGSAILPVADDADGSATLQLHSVDIGSLLSDIARSDNTISGVIDGSIETTVKPLNPAATSRDWSARLTTNTAQLLAAPVNDLQATADSGEGIIDYTVNAATLGGTIAVVGRTEPSEAGTRHQATVETTSVRIEEITRLFPGEAAAGEFTGLLSGKVILTSDGSEFTARGPVSLRDVKLDGHLLSERAAGRVILANQNLRIDSLQGTVAGAPSSGSIDFSLARPGTGSFEIVLSNAQSARFAPWIPQIGTWFSGSANMQLAGHFGAHTDGGGRIFVPAGNLKDVRISDWYIPIRWSIEAGTRQIRVNVRDSRGRMAGGRFTSNGSISFGLRTSFETSILFAGINLKKLPLPASASTQPLRGRASGSFKLAGRNVRSTSDLTGSMNITLAGLQSGRIPVIREIREVFSSVFPGNENYGDGRLEARLVKGGTVQIDRLVLTSTDSQLYGTGSVALNGKLDVIFTGSLLTRTTGPQPSSVQSVVQTAFTAAPCATVAEANRFVSERALRAEARGSFSHPRVQLRPLPILSFE